MKARVKQVHPDGGDAEGASSLPSSSERLVSQLTNGLSHETRNSLNALAIHLEVLADKLRDTGTGEISPHLEKNLAAARFQIRKLSEYVGRFNEFVSRAPEPRDLASFVEHAKALCTFQLRRADVVLHVDVPLGIRLAVEPFDALRLLVETFLAVADSLPGSPLEVRASVEGPRVVVTIGERGLREVRSPARWPQLERIRPSVEEVGGSWCERGPGGRGCSFTLPLVAE